MKNNFKNNQGQVAIIVLLASAIILTLGLSLSQKTVTDTVVDTDEESLKQAFNTAESAINNYLSEGNTSYSTNTSSANINSTVIGNSINLASEGKVLENENELFWLVNHNSDGSIGTDYYKSGSLNLSVDDGFTGALKIEYFYIEGGVYKVKRFGCNYGGSNLVNGYNSDTSSCSNITLNGSPLLFSVTPLGSATVLTISGTSNFPLQGEEIVSNSTTDSGVKTQIKTRFVYKFPAFMLDAIIAKNIVQ